MEPQVVTSVVVESVGDGISSRYPDLVLQRGKLGLQFSSDSECPTSSTAELKSQTYSSESLAVNMVNDGGAGGGEDEGKKCCKVCRRSCCSCRSNSEDDGEGTGKKDSSLTVTFDDEFMADRGFDKNGRNQMGKDVKVEVFGRKWEHFPGKNNFYFNGRLMTAPSVKFCLFSFFLIFLTFVLFTVFDGPFFADRLTIAIPIIGCVLFVLVIVNMVKTSCSDPGILPRASAQESEFVEKSYASSHGMRPPPRTKDILVNGQTIKSKYCFTCKMFRPPRASHCSVCDNCVDRFDHHCPFLGNCIGKRNYRNFYAFIVCLSLLAVFVLSFSITKLAMLGKEHGNFLDALRESPTSAIVILISFFGMWTVIGLAGFHTYLIAVEQTTNEDIKGIFGRTNTINPYSKENCCQNCCFILCGPHHPSLIDSRGYVTADFLASLPKKNGGNDSSMSAQNPPTSIQPHFQEKAGMSRDTGAGQVGATPLYPIQRMESGGHKMNSLQAVQSTPNINNSSSSHFPKAGTVPADPSGRFPGYNASQMGHYESSEETLTDGEKSSWAPKLQVKSVANRSNVKTYTNPDHSRIEDDEMVMSMVELDHLGNLQRHHNNVQLRNSQPRSSEDGRKVLSTSIPLISNSSSATTTTTDNSQSHYKKLSRKLPVTASSSYARQSKSSSNLSHAEELEPSASSTFATTSPLSAVNAPVALAFGDPDDQLTTSNLERFTMINSPLHLDSIS